MAPMPSLDTAARTGSGPPTFRGLLDRAFPPRRAGLPSIDRALEAFDESLRATTVELGRLDDILATPGLAELVADRAVQRLQGASVAFTGAGGRSTAERSALAATYGFTATTRMRRDSVLLVLATPGTETAQVARASAHGIPTTTEPAFWRHLGALDA